MKILHVIHRIPYPPDKGDKIRSYHQLRCLSERHDVWCACFVDDDADVPHGDILRRRCRDLVAIPLSRPRAAVRGVAHMAIGRSVSEGYYADRRMRRALRAWCTDVDFDAALVFSSAMAPYHRVIRARRTVLDFCDWDSLKWRAYAARRSPLVRPLFRLEARRLARAERRWIGTYDACTVVTQAEADAIDEATGPGPRDAADASRAHTHGVHGVHVVGNGVTTDTRHIRSAAHAANRIGFVGQMDYWPNVDAVRWFADAVWPNVRRQVPDATFEIVGRAPTPEVVALARHDGIQVTGEVADVRRHIEQFAVSVAPLRIGRGVQNKVLEAMAASRPVVLSAPAAAGIDADDGRHFLVANDPHIMTHDLVTLLTTPSRRVQIGNAARAHVARRYSWRHEMMKLESLLAGPAPHRSRQHTMHP